MKYYSETLKRIYDSEEDCKKAENEFLEKQKEQERKEKELADTRKARAKEVEDAFKEANTAYNKFVELKKKFVKDYGNFHMTFDVKNDFANFFDVADFLFRL